MSTIVFRALATTLPLWLTGSVLGTPIQWSSNGHFYEAIFVGAPITWESAKAAAVAAGGHLATITSRAENNFVFSLVNHTQYWSGYSGPWLGGYQEPATTQPNGNWRWVTGEPWTFTNWQAGQPNDSGGKVEDKLQFGFAAMTSLWNDIMSVDPTPAFRPVAYVVEWNYDPLAPTLKVRSPQDSSEVEMCWETEVGRYYQILHCSALSTSQWVPLTTNWIVGDGTIHCEVDPVVAGSEAKFYRLLCTNAPPPP